MASRFFSIQRGGTEFSVTEGGATTGAPIEVRIDTTVNPTKNEVFMALDYIRNNILKSANIKEV
jgi:hypothetical protein